MLKFGGSSCLIWDPEWEISRENYLHATCATNTAQSFARIQTNRHRTSVLNNSFDKWSVSLTATGDKTGVQRCQSKQRGKTLTCTIQNTSLQTLHQRPTRKVSHRHNPAAKQNIQKYTVSAEWGSQTLRQACYRENPESAMCVQNLNDSRGLAIRITYRISLRSSSLWEPRHPPLKVVMY